MFFFWHPRPVVDRRPVAEQSVQTAAPTLPMLTEVAAQPAPPRPSPQPGDSGQAG